MYERNSYKRIIGVDVGGVITDILKNDGTDTSFLSDNYLQTTAVPDAFESLKILNSDYAYFKDLVRIVSKAGPEIEQKTRNWFKHNGFYDITGISPEHVYFCRERKDKAPICERLGITHFVDDNIEVMSHLRNIVPNKYLFCSQANESELGKYSDLSFVHVGSWKEVLELVK